MDFSTLAVFCDHHYFENGHEMPWGRRPKHTFNGICRRFCAPSFPKLFFCKKNCHILNFSAPPRATTNKHINSHTTISAARINTYVASCAWTINKHINSRTTKNAQRIDKYITSMKINHKQTYQLTYHHNSTAYQHLCHVNEDEPWRAHYQEHYHTPPPPRTAPNEDPAYQHLCHVNEDEPWRAHYQERYHTSPIPPETAPTNTQRINTYVTSMKMNHEERTIKNVITPPHAPEPPPTNTQRINTYVTSMKMNHEERTIKNVITPPPPALKPPQPTPSVSTPMSRQWRWTMKSALSRTLSHPHPPNPPPTNTQRINTYVTSMKMNHEERTIKNVITPPPPEPPPQPTPSVSTPMSRQWRWTTEDLVEHLHVKRTKWTTSSCKTTSMYETHVQSIKMCKLSGAPSPRVTKNMSNDFNVSVSGFYVTCAAHVQRMCSACAAHVQRLILDWLWLQAPLYSYTH